MNRSFSYFCIHKRNLELMKNFHSAKIESPYGSDILHPNNETSNSFRDRTPLKVKNIQIYLQSILI